MVESGPRPRSRVGARPEVGIVGETGAHDHSGAAAAARALVKRLRPVVAVTFVPLGGSVARLDTTTPQWLLELDSDSPVWDHCWAMIDVLRVVSRGASAARFATTSGRLRPVES
jgi:hypothetical protein